MEFSFRFRNNEVSNGFRDICNGKNKQLAEIIREILLKWISKDCPCYLHDGSTCITDMNEFINNYKVHQSKMSKLYREGMDIYNSLPMELKLIIRRYMDAIEEEVALTVCRNKIKNLFREQIKIPLLICTSNLRIILDYNYKFNKRDSYILGEWDGHVGECFFWSSQMNSPIGIFLTEESVWYIVEQERDIRMRLYPIFNISFKSSECRCVY
jgi:hypothetical protein